MGRMTDKQIKDMSKRLSDIYGKPEVGVDEIDFLTRSLGRLLGEYSEVQRENQRLKQIPQAA